MDSTLQMRMLEMVCVYCLWNYIAVYIMFIIQCLMIGTEDNLKKWTYPQKTPMNQSPPNLAQRVALLA